MDWLQESHENGYDWLFKVPWLGLTSLIKGPFSWMKSKIGIQLAYNNNFPGGKYFLHLIIIFKTNVWEQSNYSNFISQFCLLDIIHFFLKYLFVRFPKMLLFTILWSRHIPWQDVLGQLILCRARDGLRMLCSSAT